MKKMEGLFLLSFDNIKKKKDSSHSIGTLKSLLIIVIVEYFCNLYSVSSMFEISNMTGLVDLSIITC